MGVVTISALLVFASPGLGAVVPFGPESVITTAADGARSVHAADVDGDGDVDVLSASYEDDTVAWYENNGASPPSFTRRVISSAEDSASSVYAADVDGDGNTDVLSASLWGDTIAWYEHNGAKPAGFTRRVVTTAADGAYSVHAADVDGDGDVDVLSASYVDDTVAWYENNGASPPGFTERVLKTAADGAYSVHAADVDGDGDVDVLSASSLDDTVAWYENNGASPPSFTEHVITTAADGARSVHAADVDGDGDIDLLSASSDDDTIAWYESDGGSPPSFTEHVITAAADGAISVDAADVDGDGDVDVLSASWLDDTVAWYENTSGDGLAWTFHMITSAADGAISVDAADVDGDGEVDVLSASHLDDTVAWYENRSPHPDLTFRGRRITAAADGAFSVHAADVDGDGDMDPLSASIYSNTIAWFENDGTHPPSFTERVITTEAIIANSVQPADVDGDGDIDVLSGSTYSNTIAWYENQGTNPPSFTEHPIAAASDEPRSIRAADVDGDGDVDLLSVFFYSDQVWWFENNGSSPPGFTPRVITSAADGPMSVHAADVDGDGDMDVLSVTVYDHTAAWYENNGAKPPGFTRRVVTTAANGPWSIDTADVDGDGDTDVLLTASYDNKVAWYENNGARPPSFTERVITTTADGAKWVHAADVDSDGDMDILSASYLDDTVAWYENDGASPPSFTERVIATGADEARSVHAADVNGDGDVDILSASGGDDIIRWYENRSDVAVILPPDGDPVDCGSPGVRATRPLIRWDPGPYDRFRVQISWDPAFAKGARITSGKELLKKKAWRPGAKTWRRACNNAAPYLYIRVFGQDLNIRKKSPIRNVMSEPVEVEPMY
jgi:hypothetical protein